MAIYKPSLLDKFKDFVNGLRSNWDEYETHVADFESHLADYANLKVGSEIYTATLQGGWSGTLKYKKNGLGTVVVWGDLTVGTITIPTTIATLPVGFRPLEHLTFTVYGTSGTNLLKGLLSLGINKDNGNIFVLYDSGLVQGETIRVITTFQI